MPGLPDQPRNKRQAAWLALPSTGVGAAGISLVPIPPPRIATPVWVVRSAPASVNVPLQVTVNWLSRRGQNRDEDRDRVLLVRANRSICDWVDDLRLELEHGATLVGFIPTSDCESGGTGAQPLVELQRSSRATVVVLDHEAQASEAVTAQAARLHEAGVRIRNAGGVPQALWLGKLPSASWNGRRCSSISANSTGVPMPG
ncbi:MAG: hypothetical protein R2735_13000 [Microthrixaceae bacterium]